MPDVIDPFIAPDHMIAQPTDIWVTVTCMDEPSITAAMAAALAAHELYGTAAQFWRRTRMAGTIALSSFFITCGSVIADIPNPVLFGLSAGVLAGAVGFMAADAVLTFSVPRDVYVEPHTEPPVRLVPRSLGDDS
jgi:hypothetical protein